MSEVVINRVTYESVESAGCKCCAFDTHVIATKDCLAVRCERGGKSVIYVKKEMACHGDDDFKPFVECSDTVREPARPFIDKTIKEAEWDERYETFERHYPLIKWAVVAGLLGLVWLVSL